MRATVIEKARTKSKHTASARRRASWASATFVPKFMRLIAAWEKRRRMDIGIRCGSRVGRGKTISYGSETGSVFV